MILKTNSKTCKSLNDKKQKKLSKSIKQTKYLVIFLSRKQ